MDKRYERQIKLSTVGIEGQKAIINKSVLIIGCGGLGSYVASEFTRTGVGKLTLVDPDTIEVSNLQRQAIFTEEDAKNNEKKVVALKNALNKVNSETKISIFPIFFKNFFENNQERFDLIMDCTDNFKARVEIDDYSQKSNTPFIFGSCAGTSGSFMFLDPKNKIRLSDIFKKPSTLSSKGASTVGILTPIVPLIASYQVALALEYFVKGDLAPYFYQVEAWPPELHSFLIKKES